MSPLGGHSLSNPVDQTWQSLREAVLAHPRIAGARFDHDTKRVDLQLEKAVVPSGRRLSALVTVDAEGTRVVISGAGKRGLSHQVATELLAEVSHRLAGPAPDDASLPAATVSDELSELATVSQTDRAPRTPPAPPPPPSASPAPRPPAAPPRPTATAAPTPATPRLSSPPKRPPMPAHDALSELADGNDWR
jgi:hypothetical protein